MLSRDVFVRRDREPNVDLKSGAMAMLVAWSDNGYAASRNALIVCFQPLDLFSRAAGDGSEPSKVISGVVCISVLSAGISLPCQSASHRMVAPCQKPETSTSHSRS
jgi:hypothetical protein